MSVHHLPSGRAGYAGEVQHDVGAKIQDTVFTKMQVAGRISLRGHLHVGKIGTLHCCAYVMLHLVLPSLARRQGGDTRRTMRKVKNCRAPFLPKHRRPLERVRAATFIALRTMLCIVAPTSCCTSLQIVAPRFPVARLGKPRSNMT